MPTLPRPTAGDAAPYYCTYIDQVPQGDVLAVLENGVAFILAGHEIHHRRGLAERYLGH